MDHRFPTGSVAVLVGMVVVAIAAYDSTLVRVGASVVALVELLVIIRHMRTRRNF